ncbi:MAG: hypothetical protein JWP87_5446 [Labilithrix sp.]|nr:hypothetical protein [Labilithrix sp.]
MKRLPLSVLLAVLLPAAAAAAPAPECSAATMLPDVARVPANFPGFAYSATNATAKDVHLVDVASSAELAVVLGPVVDGVLKVAPAMPFTAGKAYELRYEPFCSFAPTPTTPLFFEASAAAPLPTTLGEAKSPATADLQPGGSAFAVTALVKVAPEMQPWLPAYRLSVVVDGEPLSTNTTSGADAGEKVLDGIGFCSAALAASPKHTVRIRATLAFAPTLETTPASLDLFCPAPKPAPVGPAPGVAVPVATDGGGSSGCSTSGASSSSLALGGAALGALVVARARRRRATR